MITSKRAPAYFVAVDENGNTGIELGGGVVENQRVKVDIGGAEINATIDGIKSDTIDVLLQDAVSATGNGTPFVVGAYKTLTLEITGTATSNTVIFEGSSSSGAWYPIQGVKLQDLSLASQTSGKGEVWQFDVTGLVAFRARISAVVGGNLSVKGRAVS